MITENKFKQIIERKWNVINEYCSGRKIWIYGAGHGGGILAGFLSGRGIAYEGFVDRRRDIKQFYNKPIVSIEDVNNKRDYLIISLFTIDRTIWLDMSQHGFSFDDYYYLVAGETVQDTDIVYRGCKIGKYTYGYESFLKETFYAGESFVKHIGRFCSINSTARAYGNHLLGCVSSHEFLHDFLEYYPWEKAKTVNDFVMEYELNNGLRNDTIIIGNDVWIGANVIILPGVHIGDGAIIGAGSIVNKNVDDYSITCGVPAEHKKYRFSLDIIEKMREISWWNWSNQEILNRLEYFYLPELFVKAFG